MDTCAGACAPARFNSEPVMTFLKAPRKSGQELDPSE